MRSRLRRTVATTLAVSLLLATVPATAWAAKPGGRIEGLLLDLEGHPAAGHQVVLVDPAAGAAVTTATISENGLYSFKDVAPGTYAMGIRAPEGSLAPVAAEPVRLAPGQLVRRDMVLVESDPAGVNRATTNYGLATWWVSRTNLEKVWTVIAIVGGLGIVYALVDSDNETKASPSSP